MRIVVTGASGNVGTALLRKLVATGIHHELIGVMRRPPKPIGVYELVRWHQMDLAEIDAAKNLRHVFERADAVVHLAWAFNPTRDEDYLNRVGAAGLRRARGGGRCRGRSVGAHVVQCHLRRRTVRPTGGRALAYHRHPVVFVQPLQVRRRGAARRLRTRARQRRRAHRQDATRCDRPAIRSQRVDDRRSVETTSLTRSAPRQFTCRPASWVYWSTSAGAHDCNPSTVVGSTWPSVSRCWTVPGPARNWTGARCGPLPRHSPT
ncbi:MAG: hypothetical protein QOI01_197 [Mycobacterium sp.]|jgi:hypothetical protein|nr:hypothetical protein [Mycobacterium sp.]